MVMLLMLLIIEFIWFLGKCIFTSDPYGTIFLMYKNDYDLITIMGLVMCPFIFFYILNCIDESSNSKESLKE